MMPRSFRFKNLQLDLDTEIYILNMLSNIEAIDSTVWDIPLRECKVVVNNNGSEILHNDIGPAYIRFNNITGELVEVSWYKNGKRHRGDGPAFIVSNDLNDLYAKIWFLDGRILDKYKLQDWFTSNNIDQKKLLTKEQSALLKLQMG